MSDFGLLTLLKEGIELLQRSKEADKADAARRFAAVYRPMFDNFLRIHANYLLILQHAQAALVDAAVHPAASGDAVPALRTYFSAQRQAFDGERTHLRSLAAHLVRSAATVEEQHFLWAVLCYFLEHAEPIKTIEQLDRQVSLLLREQGGSVLPTPATYLLELFERSDDAQALHKATRHTVEALGGYCSSVCVAYAALQARLAA